MASREQKRASYGRIKIAAFCAFILCTGLLLRLYELPGFVNYHRHEVLDVREEGKSSILDLGHHQTTSLQNQTASESQIQYVSSSNNDNNDNNDNSAADHQPAERTVDKNLGDFGLESHAEEGMMVLDSAMRFVEKEEKNQTAAEEQQLDVADHDLGADLHEAKEEAEEFSSNNIVKKSQPMVVDHIKEQTEILTAVRLMDSADDEEDEGSRTESLNSLNAHEMNEMKLASEEEADGDEMSEEAGDELELIPDKDLVAADKGGFQQDSESSRFSTKDNKEPDDTVVDLGVVDDKEPDNAAVDLGVVNDKEPEDAVVDSGVVDGNINDSVLPSNRSSINLQEYMESSDWNLPQAIPRTWEPLKPCATVEEMGSATVGDTRAASLRVRRMIQTYLAEYGVDQVRTWPAEQFCKHGFVIGQPQQDGFGNNMYKVLSAAGLAMMLNRSLIIGERGATNIVEIRGAKRPPKPAFGEYLDFSNQTFTMKEVRHLWAIHQCAHKYQRPLVMHIDRFELHSARSARCLCDDWTTSTHPIIWFKGTIDTIALQYVLKNAHPAMRSAAAKLLGNPSIPSSRPNTFGELFRALIAPNAEIQEAVQWALKGGRDPDISLHLRMLHRKDRSAPIAASSCIKNITEHLLKQQSNSRRQPRVVVVSDTSAIYPEIKRLLGQSAEVIQFNHLEYLSAVGGNVSDVISLHHGEPPRKRIKDWGEMPRWVAIVDFFLAARARMAVVSGAYRRVSTTYAQLVGALAAAYSLDESEDSHPSVYYSSLQPAVVSQGLASQSGWGHTWRPFGGKLGCKNQVAQCAKTALLPYAWWDAPWQSPLPRDIRLLRSIANINEVGQVSEPHMDKFCAATRKAPLTLVKLMVPTCTEETPCS